MVSQALFNRAIAKLSAAHGKKSSAAIPWVAIIEALFAMLGGCFGAKSPTVAEVKARAQQFDESDRSWLTFTVRRALRSEGGWRALAQAPAVVDTLIESAKEATDDDIKEAIGGEFDWDV